MQTVLTIGEVVKRSGVAASALRFYEERGLIRAIRSGSGHRRYHRGVLRRVAFIVFAQRIGLSLTQIAELLNELPTDAAPSRRDWQRISRSWQEHLDAQLAELQRLRVGLGECIGCGCLSLDKCQLANPQDRMGKRGAGPRIWIGDQKSRT